MALLKSIDDLKKYVSVNKNIDWASIEPYIKQADRKYIKNLTGDLVYDDWDTTVPSGMESQVYELFREASANLCWFLYLPLANVQVTDNGISVAEGENFKAAAWWQIRDLQRSFVEAGFSALDEALKIMEANEVTFDPWADSEGYTIFNELFVKRTDTFNRWFHIGYSRRTFLSLRHHMLEAHHEYFTSKLDDATIATINLAVQDTHKRVLDLLQASQVNYAVAKAIHSGAFEVTETGIYQKMEEFPGYKIKPLGESQTRIIKSERLNAGEEFYKSAIKIIEANPNDFTDYITKSDPEYIQPKNTGSVVSF